MALKRIMCIFDREYPDPDDYEGIRVKCADCPECKHENWQALDGSNASNLCVHWRSSTSDTMTFEVKETK